MDHFDNNFASSNLYQADDMSFNPLDVMTTDGHMSQNLFGAPASPFGAPASPFGAPASPFGPPASPFGAPASPFGAPASPFGAPASPFGAPACLFESGLYAFGPGQGISDVNPATVWQNSNQGPGNFEIGDQDNSRTPQSTQSSIINERGGGVTQQLGHIIPPNAVAPESFAAPTSKRTSPSRPSQEEDILKRNRSQRARDVANKRSSKSKNAKMGSREGGGGGAEDGKEAKGPKFEQYRREKNRVAAAKCRAKKKNHAQDLSTTCRQESTTNASLKHQERELRNMLTFLRSRSLQHNSSHCDCKSLHQYNIRQAQNIARVVESPGSLSTYSSSQKSAPLVNFHVPQRLQRG